MYVSCVVLLCKIRDEGKCCVVARSEVSAGQILKLYSWILLHFWQRPDRFFLNWMEQQASYIVSPSLMMKICDHNCSDDAGFLQRLCCVTLGKIIEESLLWLVYNNVANKPSALRFTTTTTTTGVFRCERNYCCPSSRFKNAHGVLSIKNVLLLNRYL